MSEVRDKEKKFKLKSELELFKALQKYGKLSNEALSKKTGISATTIQSIFRRIEDREFYHIRAVPKLEKFSGSSLFGVGNLPPGTTSCGRQGSQAAGSVNQPSSVLCQRCCTTRCLSLRTSP